MSLDAEKTLKQLLSPSGLAEIDRWIQKYPADQKQSAVMQALMITQQEHGYLTPELMNAVADYLEMPAIAVYEVATFYSMYHHQPVGRHLINVCTNISCKLRGSARIMEHLEQTLHIQCGQTTADGRFSLRSVECLGACVGAPMVQIGTEYHENLTKERLNAILEDYS